MHGKNDADVFMDVGSVVPRSETDGGWQKGSKKAGRSRDKEMGVEREVTEGDRRRGGMCEGTD